MFTDAATLTQSNARLPDRPLERIEQAAVRAENLARSLAEFIARFDGPLGEQASVMQPITTGYVRQLDRLNYALNEIEVATQRLHEIG